MCTKFYQNRPSFVEYIFLKNLYLFCGHTSSQSLKQNRIRRALSSTVLIIDSFLDLKGKKQIQLKHIVLLHSNDR